MQDDSDKLFTETNKKILLKVLGQIIHDERKKINKGINLFSYEYDLGNGILSKLEKGQADSRISTLWKLANAFGYKCSDLIRMVEENLPDNFNFYE